jgi:hypothetical protein
VAGAVVVGFVFGETLVSGFEVGGGSMPDFEDARRKGLNRDSLRPDEGLRMGGDGDVCVGVDISGSSIFCRSEGGTSSVCSGAGTAGGGRLEASESETGSSVDINVSEKSF